MGGAGPKGFKPAEMKKGKPQSDEGSEGSSKIRQIFSSLKERWSSRLSPLPGAPQATPVPEFDERDAQGARIFHAERFGVVQRLLENIKGREMFWEQDLVAFFERISQLFDEECGSYDMYNQRCCVAVLALSETMHKENGGLEKMGKLGASQYLEWAALNSIDSGIRKVSLLFLKKMGEWEAIGRIADPSNKDAAIRGMAQKMVLG